MFRVYVSIFGSKYLIGRPKNRIKRIKMEVAPEDEVDAEEQFDARLMSLRV